jgi:hypothetical protein
MSRPTLAQLEQDHAFPYWAKDLIATVRMRDPLDVLLVLDVIAQAIDNENFPTTTDNE